MAAYGGDIVNDIPPRARGVAMMFQSYGLYPHFTVRNNIASVGLGQKGGSKPLSADPRRMLDV